MRSFKNANVYIEGEGIKRTDLLFDDRTVGFSSVPGAEVIDLPQDAVVLPAFIDEHIHGAAGHDVMDGGDAVKRIAGALPAEGTAYFLATTMTMSKPNIILALDGVKRVMSSAQNGGAELLGAHLEGPFISYKHMGAQAPDHIVEPSIQYFDELYAAAGGNIKMLTLAPETGAYELIAHASGLGVTVSIGHTDAKYDDVSAAIDGGATCITHTYNAQRGIHHREIGTVGAALLNDRLYAELIADGIHVSIPAIRLLIKSKPRDKVILITDAMRAKGMPDGVSELGGQKVTVSCGEARLSSGALAGSVLKMNEAVRNMVRQAGVSLCEASDFASKNPAKNLGLDELGGIKQGKRASYTVLDGNFEVIMTIRDGKTIYTNEARRK